MIIVTLLKFFKDDRGWYFISGFYGVHDSHTKDPTKFTVTLLRGIFERDAVIQALQLESSKIKQAYCRIFPKSKKYQKLKWDKSDIFSRSQNSNK